MLTRNVLLKSSPASSINKSLRLGRQLRCQRAASSSLGRVQNSDVVLVNELDSGVMRGTETRERDLVLGLRSSQPPDSITASSKKAQGKRPRKEPSEDGGGEEGVGISDAEWEIRTGRALFVLQETLPEFFKIGLVTNVDKSTGTPVQSSSVLPLSLGPSANPLDFLQQSSHVQQEEPVDVGVESIYSRQVKLEYTPPTALPAPFPRTFHVEGLPLYLASASFMRHTMNALYSDLAVTLMKVSFNGPSSPSSKDTVSLQDPPGGLGEVKRRSEKKRRQSREKSVVVRFMVTGKARVSGGIGEWEVESTYIFSPISGLIHKQIINSIHPAPHQAVYDSLSKMLGFGWGSGGGSVRKLEGQDLSEHSDSDHDEIDVMDDEESLHGGSEPAESDEGEEWGGTGVSVSLTSHNHEEGHGKLGKPPTGEELRVIKDAADLFRSNSFKLQIDALLPNVRPKPSRTPPLERFLLALHTFIMEIPSISQQHPLQASRKMLKKGIAVPYTLPHPTEETNWKVGYESPSEITLVGSWPNKMSVKPKDGLRYGVDLAVEMPDSLFQEKDYLNGRFFQKCAFYLAAIAAAIKSSKKKDMNVDVLYESPSGDPRLTNLVLIPRKDDSATDFTKLNAKVVIIPTVSKTCPIPLNRLSPSHSNLRISSSSSSSSNEEDPTQNQPRHIPSPTYNTALLHAFTPRLHLLSTHNLKNEAPAFSDAVTLLRIWANQRGFAEVGENRLCVRGFEQRGLWWSAIVSLVVLGEEQQAGSVKGGGFGKRKALGRGLSSYQMFKAALDFLAKFEFERDAVFVKTANGHKFSPEDYDVQKQPVFVDSTSLVNLLSGVPRGALELLRYEALHTLETLNQTTISGDSFTEVFLKDQRNLPTRFDSILRVDLSDAKPRNLSLDETMDKGSAFNALIISIDAILHKGLGDRTKCVTILSSSSTSARPLARVLPNTPDVIYIGLVHHAQHATRLVDHGPAAEEEDKSVLDAFRELWGEKAELRRFKDGRIVESVVWDVKTAEERAHIPTQIVRFLLHRHFGIPSLSSSSSSSSPSSSTQTKAVQGWQSAFDSILRLPEEISKIYLNSGLPVGFKSALNAFDGLVKSIKALDDELPLATLNISPISSSLRYASVFTPVPLTESLARVLPPTAQFLPHIELILEFEKSSKWPDELKAIQKIKLAFFERVAQGLMKSVEGLRARVVLGDGRSGNELVDQAFLEVLTEEGWAFKLRIWNEREAVLLDRIIAGHDPKAYLPHVKSLTNQKQKGKGKEYHDSVYAKQIYTTRFIHSPRHHRAIAALSHRYTAYAGTVRLVKRWLAAHWVLLGHGGVSEEAVELICAKAFVGDGSKKSYVGLEDDDSEVKQPGVPATKERGFACVVELLKEWKWEEGMEVMGYAEPVKAKVHGLPEEERDGEGADGEGAGVGARGKANAATKKDVKASSESAWTITTGLDKEGKMWTSSGPDVVVAHRIKALATATWEYLNGIEKGNADVQALFVHPTNDYDFIIQLDPSILPRYMHNVTVNTEKLTKRGKYANKMLDGLDGAAAVRPGFDPAKMFFDDLQRVYTDTFKIFRDPFGGDQFGAVWDPSVKQPRRLECWVDSRETERGSGKGKDLVELNKKAIFEEIERMGAGLVKKIVVRT
ncbi:hypothetical protein NP233_g152 [Leucocoprinus birnbaumii]|uniref:U3 small nucleolar RNA-associated protein 22 n=1 Tax=Leucocoprinus birnbaumii TaxID=56174 RepID=A0AAD5W458_9AGAR|nr:hypothetical protein NP233_g152 [Leucocoprinus birnbaumii]